MPQMPIVLLLVRRHGCVISEPLPSERKADLIKGIYKVAELTADLRDDPQNIFKECSSLEGRTFYRLKFDLEISVQSSLQYSLLVDGVRYGSVSAKYT